MAELSPPGSTVYAHTGPSATVWVAAGGRPPADTGARVWEFADSPLVGAAERVRLMGTRGNAALAVRLAARRGRGALRSVELCSPLACSTGARRDKPAEVLADLPRWQARASCGGWREFAPADHASCRLAELDPAGRGAAGSALHLLMEHPAWPALAAVPHLSPLAVGGLVGVVLDPRFFVDPAAPDRLSKLESFLGLEPKIAVTQGRPEAPTPQHVRYRAVLACWKLDDPGAEAAAVTPELFVWRAYYDAGGGHRGDLSACKRFVHYLRHTWLDGLYPGLAERLFVPEFFFDAGGARWYRAATGCSR